MASTSTHYFKQGVSLLLKDYLDPHITDDVTVLVGRRDDSVTLPFIAITVPELEPVPNSMQMVAKATVRIILATSAYDTSVSDHDKWQKELHFALKNLLANTPIEFEGTRLIGANLAEVRQASLETEEDGNVRGDFYELVCGAQLFNGLEDTI